MGVKDKQTDWRERLELRLEDFVDEFVVDGASHDEVFDAIVEKTAALREALERDPEPAGDPTTDHVISEPANDGPAAP